MLQMRFSHSLVSNKEGYTESHELANFMTVIASVPDIPFPLTVTGSVIPAAAFQIRNAKTVAASLSPCMIVTNVCCNTIYHARASVVCFQCKSKKSVAVSSKRVCSS